MLFLYSRLNFLKNTFFILIKSIKKIVLLLIFSANFSFAAPDAGSIQQQIERERDSTQAFPRSTIVEKEKPQLANKPLIGPTFTVREFIFEGNTLLGSDQLSSSLATCLNREIDFQGLKSCGVLVTEEYQSLGWVAKAVIPPQDVIDGKVVVKIIEARFGGVTIVGPLPQRVRDTHLLKIFDNYQKTDDLLNMNELDRALLLADDLPGVGVTGNLDQGETDGLTNLVLQLADEPLVTGNASLDNFGSTSTGLNRANANFIVNSPLRIGDLLNINTMASQGTRYIRVEETVPVGYSGLRVGVNASHLQYQLTDAQFSTLGANGLSQTVGLSADFPVIRTRQKNLNATFNFDNKFYLNQANGSTTSDYSSRSVSFGVNGNTFDEFLGGGANYASLTWTVGYLDLNGSGNQLSDSITANTQGNFTKARYSISRQQKLTPELSAYANFTGQMTQRNLDSSESFYLGGITGVRAYPTSEGRGSQGQLLNLELRRQLPNGFNFSGFFDWGRVTTYPNNSFTGSPNPNEFDLKGYGLSLTWQTNSGATLKGLWARRYGENPNPGIYGTDQDGTLVVNRFWLSASLTF